MAARIKQVRKSNSRTIRQLQKPDMMNMSVTSGGSGGAGSFSAAHDALLQKMKQ